jgi:hypothetical protein
MMDEEFVQLGGSNCLVLGGGVLPMVHAAFLVHPRSGDGGGGLPEETVDDAAGDAAREAAELEAEAEFVAAVPVDNSTARASSAGLFPEELFFAPVAALAGCPLLRELAGEGCPPLATAAGDAAPHAAAAAAARRRGAGADCSGLSPLAVKCLAATAGCPKLSPLAQAATMRAAAAWLETAVRSAVALAELRAAPPPEEVAAGPHPAGGRGGLGLEDRAGNAVVRAEDVVAALGRTPSWTVWGTGRFARAHQPAAHPAAVAALAPPPPLLLRRAGAAAAAAGANGDADADGADGADDEQGLTPRAFGGRLAFWLAAAAEEEAATLRRSSDEVGGGPSRSSSSEEEEEEGVDLEHPLYAVLKGTPLAALLAADGRAEAERREADRAEAHAAEARAAEEGDTDNEAEGEEEEEEEPSRLALKRASLCMVRGLQLASPKGPCVPFAPFAVAVADLTSNISANASWSPVAVCASACLWLVFLACSCLKCVGRFYYYFKVVELSVHVAAPA